MLPAPGGGRDTGPKGAAGGCDVDRGAKLSQRTEPRRGSGRCVRGSRVEYSAGYEKRKKPNRQGLPTRCRHGLPPSYLNVSFSTFISKEPSHGIPAPRGCEGERGMGPGWAMRRAAPQSSSESCSLGTLVAWCFMRSNLTAHATLEKELVLEGFAPLSPAGRRKRMF